jgi:transcriptional regulator with XRE-family HTH domain
MNFADWLIAEMNKNNWSQSELSRRSGLTRAAISNYVSGQKPNSSAIEKLAKAFNISPASLFEITRSKKASTSDPWVSEMEYKISLLTGTRREMAERLLNALLDEQERETNKGIKNIPAKT